MGYLGRRIGKSQNTARGGDGADGNLGGGILDLFEQGYFAREGNINRSPGAAPSGLTATGGMISDYTSGPDVYRAHIFTSSGSFQVTALGTLDNKIDYLVIAGGGSGGGNIGGGGGAGGLRTTLPEGPGGPSPSAETQLNAAVATYPVVIGAGADRVFAAQPGNVGNQGSDTVFTHPGGTITSTGGGGGGAGASNTAGATPGGSGGGAGGYGSAPAPARAGTSGQGYAGGDCGGSYFSGGGGGAGALGETDPGEAGGDGGAGKVVNIIPSPPSTNSGNGYYWAGGGGGGSHSGSPGGGGDGGVGGGGGGGTEGPGADGSGGDGGAFNSGQDAGLQPHPYGESGGDGGINTGGGGGGTSHNNTIAGLSSGRGGSGIIIVRYKIAAVETAKATGGQITFHGGKTIHTFTGSGTFATTSDWSPATVEYVVIGGGGSGGLKQYISGGGGAGAYRTGTTPIGTHPVSVNVQVGGGGVVHEVGPAATPAAADGTSSYFGTPITAPGGGGGGTYPNPGAGRPGGSGGGGASDSSPGEGSPATGSTFPGTIGATPTSGWGHAGGDGAGNPLYGAGGGGGAGGPGGDGTPTAAGLGGEGIQLPATFRDPNSVVGAPGPTSAPTPNGFDTSGKYWVAGGGAGSIYPTGQTPGSGGGPGGPYAGGGAGGNGNNGGDGGANTGGGGGGQERAAGPATQAGRGGSGIVIIAYPT